MKIFFLLFICSVFSPLGGYSLLSISSASGKTYYDVYYVCVGSAHYEMDFSKYDRGFYGFENILCAGQSARAVADALDKGGAIFGKTIVSDSLHLIQKNNIEQAITQVGERISKDRLERKKESKFFNPFLIFIIAATVWRITKY